MIRKESEGVWERGKGVLGSCQGLEGYALYLAAKKSIKGIKLGRDRIRCVLSDHSRKWVGNWIVQIRDSQGLSRNAEETWWWTVVTQGSKYWRDETETCSGTDQSRFNRDSHLFLLLFMVQLDVQVPSFVDDLELCLNPDEYIPTYWIVTKCLIKTQSAFKMRFILSHTLVANHFT